MSDDRFPEVLSREQLRFEILFGLRQISPGLLRDRTVKDRTKTEAAVNRMADIILARFDRLQVRGPAPLEGHSVPTRQ